VELVDDEEEENKKDPITRLLEDQLPRGKDLLEYRLFGADVCTTDNHKDLLFRDEGLGATTKIRSSLFDHTNVPANRRAHKRQTPAIYVLRQVLEGDFCFDSEEGDHPNFNTISPKLHSLLGLCISARLDLFAGAISTFDLHDDVDKWEDMYTPKNVQSTLNGGTAQYSYRLARVLKTAPYCAGAFEAIAKPAAVYDYGSVALMVDISKSFVALARMVKALLYPALPARDPAVYAAFGLVVAQVYQRNEDGVRLVLEGHNEAVKDNTPHHQTKFIQHTLGWRRAAIHLAHDAAAVGLTGATCIDNLAGYYWGARPCGVEQFNHQYLACPTLKIDPQTDTPMLNRLQAISHEGGNGRRARYAMAYLTTLHRNSLYVRSVCQTLTKMAAILKPHVPTVYVIPKLVLCPNPHADLTAIGGLYPQLAIGDIPAAPAPDTRAPVAHTLADLQRRLKAETDALDASIKQARSASSYPGISWPVLFGDGEAVHSNLGAFERVHAIPRPTPPIAQSVDRLAIGMIHNAGLDPQQDTEAILQALAAARVHHPPAEGNEEVE
jgi:hypothetical protein